MAIEYLVLMREVQLTLGSIIGLICIYFGYRLFAQIPVNVTNDGHFKMPKIGEAKLKVAPGIFFAILGAAIVYFSIDRSISIRATPSITATIDEKAGTPSDKEEASLGQTKNSGASPLTLPSTRNPQQTEYQQSRPGSIDFANRPRGFQYDCQSPSLYTCK